MLAKFLTYWDNNGTKLLGYMILINSGIAGGTVALPPPLSNHAAIIVPWAVFLNFILGALVANRGFGNTQAIASAVVQQHVEAITTAASTGTVPVIAPAGNLSPKS